MRHGEARRMLAARRYLSPDEQRRLDEHLGQCAACRAMEAEIARQDAFLTSIPAATPPASLRQAVLGGTAGSVPASRPWPRLSPSFLRALPAPLLTGVAIVLVVAAAVLHLRSGVATPRGSSPTAQSSYGPANVDTVTRDTPQGLRISLSVPNAVPAGALIRATVTVTNISGQDIPLSQGGSEIGASVLADESTGRLALDAGFAPLGPGPGNAYVRPLLFHPGQTMTRELYGVAFGRAMRATVGIQDRQGYAQTVEGPGLTLHFTQQQAPTATLRTRPDVELSVQSGTSSPGPLIYSETMSCMEDNGDEHEMGAINGPGWGTVTGPVLKSRWPTMPNFNGICTHDFEWHVVAGYLGQPVVHLDYITPSISVPVGAAVPARDITCGADRANLPELPATARHAAGETDVVRAACGGLADSTPVEVASMSMVEWKSLASAVAGAAGDRWVWIVVVHGAPADRAWPHPLRSFAYDGLSGRELSQCDCDWLESQVLNGAAPTPLPSSTPAGARAVLMGFGRAVVRGSATLVRAYLPANFRSACGHGSTVTQHPPTVSQVLCDIPMPVTGFRIVYSGREGPGRAYALVQFRMTKGRSEPLELELRRLGKQWRIIAINRQSG